MVEFDDAWALKKLKKVKLPQHTFSSKENLGVTRDLRELNPCIDI